MSGRHLDETLPATEEVIVRAKMRPVIQNLQGKTHFSDEELQALLIIYYKLTKSRPMNRRRFTEVMHTMFEIHSEVLMDRIFSAFDITNSLKVTPESWARGISIYLRGTLTEKIKFCFTVYDMIGDGLLKKELMFHTMKHCLITRPQDEDTEESIRELIDLILKKMDLDRDGNISFADYEESVKKNPGLLEVLGQCLPSKPIAYKFMTTFTNNVTAMDKIRRNAGVTLLLPFKQLIITNKIVDFKDDGPWFETDRNQMVFADSNFTILRMPGSIGGWVLLNHTFSEINKICQYFMSNGLL